MNPKLLLALTTTLALTPLQAHADSFQIQNGGGTQSQSQSPSSQSPSSQSLDNPSDYDTWPNGGGKVHHLAKVDPSAHISADSKVGPYVDIEKSAQIEKSVLAGESATKRGHVGKSAQIKASSLQGTFQLESGTKILGSTLQGPIQVKSGVTLNACSLSSMMGSAPAVIKHDMNNEMKMYPEMKGSSD